MRMEGNKMPVSKAKKRANEKYAKAHYTQLNLRVRKEYLENYLRPAVDASGESMNGYIKKALDQRIEREFKDMPIPVETDEAEPETTVGSDAPADLDSAADLEPVSDSDLSDPEPIDEPSGSEGNGSITGLFL